MTVASVFPVIVSFPFSPVHPSNALLPMLVTLAGIVSAPFIPVHPLNAQLPIVARSSLNAIVVSPVHPLNA